MHSLSAAAIEDVTITDGEERPIAIEIRMNNSSGIFQVDGLLKAKLRGSGLEPYVEVVAHIDTETEQRLVPDLPARAVERLPEGPGYNSARPLRDRLTVGRLTLDQEVGVRIPVPQLREPLQWRVSCPSVGPPHLSVRLRRRAGAGAIRELVAAVRGRGRGRRCILLTAGTTACRRRSSARPSLPSRSRAGSGAARILASAAERSAWRRVRASRTQQPDAIAARAGIEASVFTAHASAFQSVLRTERGRRSGRMSA